MYKIALIGNSEAVEILDKLVKEEYAVIFVTEDIASQIFEEIERLQETSFSSLTIIPNKLEKKYLGLKILRRNIEKAIGTDILFRKEVE
jgi:V/A-type H+-transporting ATPase subunit F